MTNEPSQPKTSGPGQKFKLVSLTLLLVGAFAAWQVSSWPTRLRYPGEIALVEGIRLVEMQHLLQGVAVYAPATPERFDAMIYGPLYYLLGMKLIDPARPAYFPLRLLCLFATLGCATGVALLAFWLSRSYFAAALAPLLFLSYGFVSLHGLSARSDMVGVFLAYCGFLVAYRFQSSRLVLWAAPLMLASFFYKQQFVAAPTAIFIFLVLERRYRLAAQFAGLMGLGVLGLLGLFQYVVFSGQDFLLHFVTYNLVPFTWNRFGYGGLLSAVIFGIPLLVGLEFLRQNPNKLLASYLGCAIAFTWFSLSKEGSGTNYFLEVVLILSPLFACLVAKTIDEPFRTVELLCLLSVTLLAGTRLASLTPQPEDFLRDRAIQNYLRRNFAPGTLACSRFGGDLVRAGLEMPISDLYQYTWLVCRGKIPAEELMGHFRRRRFGVLLLPVDLYDEKEAHNPNEICLPEPLHRAILQNYRFDATLEMPGPEQGDHPTRMYAWVPRPESESADPPKSR